MSVGEQNQVRILETHVFDRRLSVTDRFYKKMKKHLFYWLTWIKIHENTFILVKEKLIESKRAVTIKKSKKEKIIRKNDSLFYLKRKIPLDSRLIGSTKSILEALSATRLIPTKKMLPSQFAGKINERKIIKSATGVNGVKETRKSAYIIYIVIFRATKSEKTRRCVKNYFLRKYVNEHDVFELINANYARERLAGSSIKRKNR